MQKTLFITHWPGGGVWGLKQLVQANYIEEKTGLPMADLSDLHITSSIGSLAGNILLIPNDTDPSRPKFTAGELIEPFKDVAMKIFGDKGVNEHYEKSVRHDIAQSLGTSRFGKAAASLIKDSKHKIHKPHHILRDAIHQQIGDVKLSNLLKSSITLTHSQNTGRRSCFAHFNPSTFDATQWNQQVIHNYGDDINVVDAIMTSTAASTVFNAYKVQDQRFIDMDHLYSCYLPVKLACHIQRHQQMGISMQTRILQVTCGIDTESRWDIDAYQNSGPIGIMAPFIASMGFDQQHADQEMLKMEIGKNNILTLGGHTSTLRKMDSNDLPASDIFNANAENLERIEVFAHDHIKTQHDAIMRYVDMVVETRAKESQSDPLATFSGAANNNNQCTYPQHDAGGNKSTTWLSRFLPRFAR